jgi:hypothetical protein
MTLRCEADVVAPLLELLVDVRADRAVIAEHVVVRERVAEEVRAVDAAARSPRPRRGWHIIGRTTRTRGFTAKPAGRSGSDAMIARYSATHSAASSGSTNAKLSAPHALLRPRGGSSRGASTRPRAAGAAFCSGLGTTLRCGIETKRPSMPGERLLDEHPRDGVERLVPLRALRRPVDAEALELGAARGLAGAELDAAVGDEVERRDGLGDARGVLVAGRQREGSRGRAGCARCAATPRRGRRPSGRVRVLLEEVVLDLPDRVEAHAVGDLDLLERVASSRCSASPPQGRGSWCS